MSPRNPYIVGTSVGNTPAFIGRADILGRVEAFVRQPAERGLLLFGQRRIGKTSILHQLRRKLPELGPWRPVFFDLQGRAMAPVEQILLELASTIAAALGLPPPPTGLSGDALLAGWLATTLRSLPADARVVLLLDEFDVLADPRAPNAMRTFFGHLADLLEGELGSRLAVIYAMGRAMEDLDISARPLLRGVRTIHVSTLIQPELERLLDLGEADGLLTWTRAARDEVWALTSGHPMLTQLIGSTAWYRAQQAGEPRVDAHHVRELVPVVLRESRTMLSWLWDGLTPACRIVAAALAEHGEQAVTVDDLERLLRDSGIRLVVNQLTSAPRLLRDWDLFDEVDGEFRFKVALLRQWVRKHQPFASAREYLDELVPAACDLFRTASQLWRGAGEVDDGRVAQVAVLLEVILEDPQMNPNHVGAALLLADVYTHQHRLGSAIRLLERLYPTQPAAIRARYVQLLLVQAERLAATQTEDEQLALHQHILQVAPGTHEAVAACSQIWSARGLRLRAAGKLEEAHACFDRASNTDLLREVNEQIDRRDAQRLLAEVRGLAADDRWRDALLRLRTNLPLVDILTASDALERASAARLIVPRRIQLGAALVSLLSLPAAIVFFTLWWAHPAPQVTPSSTTVDAGPHAIADRSAQDVRPLGDDMSRMPADEPPMMEFADPAPIAAAVSPTRRPRPSPGDPPPIVEARRCDEGKSGACLRMGWFHAMNYPASDPRSHAAQSYFQRACDDPDVPLAEACLQLFELHLEGDIAEFDPPLARRNLQRACLLGLDDPHSRICALVGGDARPVGRATPADPKAAAPPALAVPTAPPNAAEATPTADPPTRAAADP